MWVGQAPGGTQRVAESCPGSTSPFPRPPSGSGGACAEPGRRVVWEMAAAGLVAVAAAAEYSGPVASGANLSGANCGPSPGVVPGPSPGSWSRSVDRALEEAAVTGVLSLSGRKLREFPRGAANHDLTDTTRAGERGAGVPATRDGCGVGRDPSAGGSARGSRGNGDGWRDRAASRPGRIRSPGCGGAR